MVAHGLHENARLLALVVKGAPQEAREAAGRTATFYTGQQASDVMRAGLRAAGARTAPTLQRARSLITSWPAAEVDWEAEAAAMLARVRGEGEGEDNE